MVELRIESLYRAAWAVFQCQHAQIVVDRDRFRTRLQRRLGQEVASDIQLHVDISLGQRLNVFPDVPNPKIMLMREYYELLGLETALQEIERRIDAVWSRREELAAHLRAIAPDVERLAERNFDVLDELVMNAPPDRQA